MKTGAIVFVVMFSFLVSSSAQAKKVKYRKTQEVSFEGDSVDGVVRNPYGAYLSQKKGVTFMPLYKVRDRFDQNIKDSIDYLK